MTGVNIVDIGKAAQRYGWNVGEHRAFGTGRVGTHAPNSYHKYGEALDITVPGGADVAPAFAGGKPIPWQQRTGELRYRLAKLGKLNEVLGPGDPGHPTHVHAALKGTTDLTPQQLEWAFTGRTKDASGKLTDIMPGSQPTAQAAPPAASTDLGGDITYNVIVGPKQKKSDPFGDPHDMLSNFLRKNELGTSSAPSYDILTALREALNQKPQFLDTGSQYFG